MPVIRASVFYTLALSVMTLLAVNVNAVKPTEVPFNMTINHINLVLSVSNPAAASEFYGEVLGLERISKPADKITRYMSGASEILLIQAGPSSSKSKKPDAAAGIHLAAIFLPESERQKVTDRMASKGYETPEYNEGQGYRWGLARDMDHNLIELVFIDDGAAEEFYKYNQIGLAVSNKDETSAFLRDILGMQAGAVSPNPVVGQIHNFTLGTSTIKFFEVIGDTAPHVGTPTEITGLAIVQCMVTDIDSARSQIAERGGKIHTEPFAANDTATAMVVEGPDGILFQFVGPTP